MPTQKPSKGSVKPKKKVDPTIRKKIRLLYESGDERLGATGRRALRAQDLEDAFWVEVVRYADLHGLEKDSRGELRRHMEGWCAEAMRDPAFQAEDLLDKLGGLYARRTAPKR